MGHSHGYRSGTRHMFSRGFKQRGRLPTTQILQPLKVSTAHCSCAAAPLLRRACSTDNDALHLFSLVFEC
jgi:hypothetical protein